MERRTFLLTLAGGMLAAIRDPRAQPNRRTPVVGVLVTEAGTNISLPILVRGLRDAGYEEGKTVAIAVRSADGLPTNLPARAAELAALRVDVIYATGPAAIKAAMDATSTIPIVALDLETDPVKAGWAANLARPGRNVTGLFLDVPGLAAKWLELMKEAVPGARRIGLVWDPGTGTAQLDAAMAAAPKFGLDLRVTKVEDANAFEPALDGAVKAGAHAIIFLSSPLVSVASAKLAGFMSGSRLPALSPFRRFAENGGLMSYGPDFDAFRSRSALFVDRILKGAKAGDLPIEQPTKFELVINLKAATALGIPLPQSLLVRADQVIG